MFTGDLLAELETGPAVFQLGDFSICEAWWIGDAPVPAFAVFGVGVQGATVVIVGGEIFEKSDGAGLWLEGFGIDKDTQRYFFDGTGVHDLQVTLGRHTSTLDGFRGDGDDQGEDVMMGVSSLVQTRYGYKRGCGKRLIFDEQCLC